MRRAKTKVGQPLHQTEAFANCFGPLGFRQIFGLLWMCLRRKNPVLLVGHKVRSTAQWNGRSTALGSQSVAWSLTIRGEHELKEILKDAAA